MLEDVNYIINNNYYYNRPQQNQETGTNERAPIIQGRPFLNTSGAVIYASAFQDQFLHQGEEGDIFLQEQDYTNLRAIPTWTKEEDQQEEQEHANVDQVS